MWWGWGGGGGERGRGHLTPDEVAGQDHTRGHKGTACLLVTRDMCAAHPARQSGWQCLWFGEQVVSERCCGWSGWCEGKSSHSWRLSQIVLKSPPPLKPGKVMVCLFCCVFVADWSVPEAFVGCASPHALHLFQMTTDKAWLVPSPPSLSLCQLGRGHVFNTCTLLYCTAP